MSIYDFKCPDCGVILTVSRGDSFPERCPACERKKKLKASKAKPETDTEEKEQGEKGADGGKKRTTKIGERRGYFKTDDVQGVK